ncbi:MAG TPA: TonB family protein [Pyrinomonadaceae bacterium]|nr:TonB family protein [Pyrinomonadaceae bacterium]
MLCLLVSGAAAIAQTNLTAKAGNAPAVTAPAETDRSRDGLTGPVRRVRTEVAKLVSTDGRLAEGKHVLVELVAYDIKGNKVENQYFPIAGATLTGKEVYKYDEKGNISEMTLLNPDGTLASKEIYKYEFDFAGNWNKMTTSVAVVDGRGITFEPTEITYRSIMYYLDENMVKMVQPGAAATTTPQPTAPAAANTAANTTANTVAKPPETKPAETKPVEMRAGNNKSRDNRKNAPVQAPELPAASNAATKLAATPLDLKTPAVNTSQEVPLINLDSEPPPSPGPRPILKPVSGGVLNGTAITLPPPVYPESAKRMRTQGTVVVDVILDETGKVVSATASSGPAVLRDAAVSAALKARFSPTKLSGQPVKVSGVINYKFTLLP